MPDAPQIKVSIDREKAETLGVSFDVISSALSSKQDQRVCQSGRMQRAIIQADNICRKRTDALLRLQVPDRQNRLVPLEAFSRFEWLVGPLQVARYNSSALLRFSGDTTAPGSLFTQRLALEWPMGSVSNPIQESFSHSVCMRLSTMHGKV
ncbi:MAG: efflux RND transporter permease subunit [Pseudomonas sp.]